MPKKKSSKKEGADEQEKIRSLQEMIATAERTITSAKQMLTQIQGNSEKPVGDFSHEISSQQDGNGQTIHGTFDGQIMVGEDGKQYPVPANYASKSKLVEGDVLKLTITSDGNFVYKQIGPIERKFLIGIAQKDERGNFVIKTEAKTYQVLLAAATYFKIEMGDEVTVVVPRNEQSTWAAVENVVRKASEVAFAPEKTEKAAPPAEIETENEAQPEERQDSEEEPAQRPSAIERLEKEIEEERKKQANNDSIIDEWTPDIEQLKKEAGHPAAVEANDDSAQIEK